MTREERLDLLKQIEKDIYVSSLESTFLEDAKSCAIHSVIEELEQNPKQELYDRLEYGTDGNIYKLSLTNGTEYEQEPKISLDTYKQVTKERDIAIEQLHELGYEFGEKIPTTQERQAESDKFDAAFQDGYNNGYAQARFDYAQEPTTKNCESCRYYGSHHEVCNYCYECSLWTDGETTTKNDLGVDYISRKAVVDAFGKWCSDDKNLEHPVWFARDIISMPSITPLEPKIGHWIDDKCSVCGKGIEDLIDSREWYRNEEPKFCPFCGIKLIDSQVGDEKINGSIS